MQKSKKTARTGRLIFFNFILSTLNTVLFGQVPLKPNQKHLDPIVLFLTLKPRSGSAKKPGFIRIWNTDILYERKSGDECQPYKARPKILVWNRPTPQHIHTSLNILNLTQTLVEVSFGAAVVVVIVFFLTLRLFFPARREAKILSASSPRSNSSSAAGDGFFWPPVGLNCGGGLSDVAASSVTMAFNVVFGLNLPNRELVFGLVEGAVFSPYELSTLKKHVF